MNYYVEHDGTVSRAELKAGYSLPESDKEPEQPLRQMIGDITFEACPYCGNLFAITKINRHIKKCSSRS